MNNNILAMDKNAKSDSQPEKNQSRKKTFVTIVDNKECKPQAKATTIIHNNEIINNVVHSECKLSTNEISLENKKGKKKSPLEKPQPQKNPISTDKKTKDALFGVQKKPPFSSRTNLNANEGFFHDAASLMDGSFVKLDYALKSSIFQNSINIPLKRKEIEIINDQTNFYIDIPKESLICENLPPSAKFMSPGGSTCDDNSNHKIIKCNDINPLKGTELIPAVTKPALKFKIEMQPNKAAATKKSQNKNDSGGLLKAYNEIKESKLLGKKRLQEREIKAEEKVKNTVSEELRSVSFALPNKFDFCSSLSSVSTLQSTNHKYYEERQAFFRKFFGGTQTKINSSNDSNLINTNNLPEKDIILNPFDKSLRNEFASTLQFQRQFKEEYVPIQLQKENEQTAISKTHFIKKKQSPLNIKRHCGVSYVINSESQQLNVCDRYKPLGHLVYQGTYSTQQITDSELITSINNYIHNLFFNQPVLISCFESPDEEEMKDYLLFPYKRIGICKQVIVVNSIYELWKFAKDRYFLAINLIADPILGLRNFSQQEICSLSSEELLIKSDIHVGIMFRKATSGIKSVLKLYSSAGMDLSSTFSSSHKMLNLDLNSSLPQIIENLSGSNTTTMSMRIELYVKEYIWKNSSPFSQEVLFSFICQMEETISKMILFWNEERLRFFDSPGKESVLPEDTMCYKIKVDTFENKCDTLYEPVGLDLDKRNLSKYLNSFSTGKSSEFSKDSVAQLRISKHNLVPLIDKNIVDNSSYFAVHLAQKLSVNLLPMYIISTRDCFVFDLVVEEKTVEFEGKKFLRKEFFFNKNNVPANYSKFKAGDGDYRVGVVTYENFFTHEELNEIEKLIEKTEEHSLLDVFLPETAQKTFSGEKLKRTKFFFGSRYMWTKKQLAEPNSYVAAGIRKDVSPPPSWIKNKVEDPLAKAGILLKDFINSYALNIYHDGTEGLGQHFDDAVRFKQPIYTLRTFSDCRLSFGSQLYGFCNGAFTIPLPRGCICVMEENSYASNGVKHCIRPCDMTGKSSALILRQMHPNMVREAEKYDILVDFPSWFSSMSLKEGSTSYMVQKTLESEQLIKETEQQKMKIVLDQNKIICSEDEIQDTMNDILTAIELTSKKKKRVINKGGY